MQTCVRCIYHESDTVQKVACSVQEVKEGRFHWGLGLALLGGRRWQLVCRPRQDMMSALNVEGKDTRFRMKVVLFRPRTTGPEEVTKAITKTRHSDRKSG